MENKNNKCILYARVSSQEQEKTGYSLPAQEKLLRNFADKNGFKIIKKFLISESASGKKIRKDFNEMLNYASRNKIKKILCEKADRLTRNIKDAVKIDEWINKKPEREIFLVKEGQVLSQGSRSNDKFMWNVKVSVAQFYTDRLSEEVKKGQKEKLEQGWLPTKPPIGYKTVGERGHKIHIIDENKALLIKKMFELYSTKNYSVRKLTKEMNKRGLSNSVGNKITKSRIYELLSNPFYYGDIKWNNKIYKGKHEPIISKELFEVVQNYLKRKGVPKYRKHNYLFKGLIKCNECGGLITWEKQKKYVYGHCNHYRNCFQKKWVKELEIEKQIIDYFDKIQVKNKKLADLILKVLKESHKEESECHNSAIRELEKQHKKSQSRIDKLYDDKIDEKISEEFYNRKLKQYKKEKEEIIKLLNKRSESADNYISKTSDVLALSQKAKSLYKKAKVDDKKELLRLVFADLRLDKGKVVIQYAEPFKTLQKAVRSTNEYSKELKKEKGTIENFELQKNAFNKTKTEAFTSVSGALLRGPDSNRQPSP